MPSRSDKLRSLPKVPKVGSRNGSGNGPGSGPGSGPGNGAGGGMSRRQQYSASTKRALTDIAARLFTEQGYAATSLDAIVSGARVTKGALYHHFSGKQAVFEAVFEQVESRASEEIRKSLKQTSDPWEKALVGLRAFMEIVQDPAYQRIVIQEGPAVLGYERFREQEERSSFGLVQDMVRSVLEASTYDLSEEMLETFSRIFFGAMSAAGESVSKASDPRMAGAQVETAIAFILAGLRSLAESGIELPDPDDLLEPFGGHEQDAQDRDG